MPSRVLITVDTELTWAPYARGASWQENLACSFDPAGVGVPYQLEMLRAHGLKACFFVDPMPALVYGLEPVRRMVEPIIAAGQEVQLHIHPVWLSIAEGKAEGADFELTCFDAETQQALIAKAADLLVEAGAPRPIAFRSGSFAADRNTLQALRKLGISYDSSHNGSEHPNPSNLPLPPSQIAPVALDGVVEVPVTQIEAAPGSLRPLQLCAVSIRELREALLHAAANDHAATTIVSHSFELASRDALRPNRTICGRFEALCTFLAEHRERLPTAHFADLADLPLGRPAAPLPARRLRTTARMVQQLWSNAVYERRL
jgi:peptidoglycan/xylan/chitin deacetylase (PgdA/CDA1 family)